jgi:chemotaxis protein methyltransferase CheR
MMQGFSKGESSAGRADEAQVVDKRFLQGLVQLVSAQTGLQITGQQRETLHTLIASRLKARKWLEPEQYYHLLTTDTPEATLEWNALIMLLTTGESYFFRDKGQFALLKNTILPELIEQRRAERSLRLWSAGCSTGEEAYSLAILVDEQLPRRDAWNISIFGTDLNMAAIERAQRGLYSAWSFRMVNPELQRRYFRKRKAEWELDERIRTLVTFRPGNLVKDAFPNEHSDLHGMDLILCRNVFLYFAHEAIATVLAKFIDTLVDGGYLMTGHTELRGQHLGRLRTRLFPEALIYQRSAGHPKPRTPDAAPGWGLRQQSPSPLEEEGSGGGETSDFFPPIPTFPHTGGKGRLPLPVSVPAEELQERTASSPLDEAQALFCNGAYAAAIEKAAQVLNHDQRHGRSSLHFAAHFLMAQAYANLGQHAKAVLSCRRALDIDPFALSPYYLLAHVAEEQGDLSEAKNCWKKVLYLSPSSIAAYLELGALYEREHDAIRAQKMRATALEILIALPPHAPIELYTELTAGELAGYVQRAIEGASDV